MCASKSSAPPLLHNCSKAADKREEFIVWSIAINCHCIVVTRRHFPRLMKGINKLDLAKAKMMLRLDYRYEDGRLYNTCFFQL